MQTSRTKKDTFTIFRNDGLRLSIFVAMWHDECSTNFSKSALANPTLLFSSSFSGKSLMEEQGMHEGDG